MRGVGVALNVLGVIPARLASTRLPRKVLRDIAGRPMIAHVYERARATRVLDDLLVATDADEVLEACRRLGIPAILTSPEHPSGTDRVWEVAQGRAADVYVNIQGDEPLLSPRHIERLVEPFLTRAETQVTTLCIEATPEEAASSTVNKVVIGALGQALYFSKYPIPFDRDGRGVTRYKHPGFYAYRRHALEMFHRWRPTPLELAEGLEQLRFLEHGIPIIVVETDEPTIGVDTEADLQAVEARLREQRQ
ncbi:MAG: 3-deoxy-manno-octulosonate cytidylyltransferase [Candidatus Rokubacteria bacterium]|nr:3-deoxy-manno-octulosonate cytidylyltransferase [Candidatus Rokubacteria bacterium]